MGLDLGSLTMYTRAKIIWCIWAVCNMYQLCIVLLFKVLVFVSFPYNILHGTLLILSIERVSTLGLLFPHNINSHHGKEMNSSKNVTMLDAHDIERGVFLGIPILFL